MVLIGILVGIGSALVAYLIPWLPEQASEEASGIDRVFWFTTFICLAIFALVAAVSIYAAIKFRAGPDDPDDGAPIHGHTGLEIVWTAIPAILVTAIAVFSSIELVRTETLPDEHRTVEVTAQQFAWRFDYPGEEVTSGELVLPVGEPVELRIRALDVIHSFWVPEWRVKQDAVPGVTTVLPVTPTKTGVYPVICTELCGQGHAAMRSQARVVSPEEFEAWLTEAAGGGGEPG